MGTSALEKMMKIDAKVVAEDIEDAFEALRLEEYGLVEYVLSGYEATRIDDVVTLKYQSGQVFQVTIKEIL